ncbi:hypothetical protein B0W47_00515 [Komagataeibacter nataicola]|uniref:Uncharacterized protein n=1 Tax=Komagataeibacter nataicola TaxID=265960 RepID=A0A9N7CTH6_9PROT|nr:hypothetical protein [Komagataeibacter nataicola]AQU86185.1 hypothetical protein B0W47_00515 [Komagataeibacter nataicola]PYD65320.1 hypothetical protein CDI09_14020 [Komagataeibacter nataicola]WNM08413.1 hypothetical protein RI056_16370 [Komagataeibacter nataicola]GBR22982.1 hypothetical protein AA0616_2412 [Komagataeibacter nataicola NRIC 0616]
MCSSENELIPDARQVDLEEMIMKNEEQFVMVRLPLSGEQISAADVIAKEIAENNAENEWRFARHHYAACDDLVRAIGTPVTGGNLDSSRESFEKFYAQMCSKATGHDTTPEYVSGLRTRDTYGNRTFLNNVWKAWPEYVQYSNAYTAERDVEIARLKEILSLFAQYEKLMDAGADTPAMAAYAIFSQTVAEILNEGSGV